MIRIISKSINNTISFLKTPKGLEIKMIIIASIMFWRTLEKLFGSCWGIRILEIFRMINGIIFLSNSNRDQINASLIELTSRDPVLKFIFMLLEK